MGGVDGFAFSQEEGGSVSQADVIRAYDTRQPRRSWADRRLRVRARIARAAAATP